MKKGLDKKLIVIFIVTLVVMLVIANILLYFFLNNSKVVFKLIGEESITLGVYESYNDPGVIANFNKEDLSSSVIVDDSKVISNKLGTYEVTYKFTYEEEEMTLIRKVKVVDDEAPTLSLIGEEEIVLEKGMVYQELGCTAVDNFDDRVKDKIQITSYVNTNLEGIYEVKYTVADDSLNKSEIKRRIIVKANEDDANYKDLMESNLVTNMNFIDDGVYIEGYIKNSNGNYKIKLCKENKKRCISYDMNSIDKYYYNGNIKLSNLDNGTYYMWIDSKDSQKVVNKLSMEYQILRARLGDKLVTFDYSNNNVKVIVDDFYYEYDIVIDPGHGGTDPGASNFFIDEKTINLEQSLYEKERFEEHGLKVLLLRSDDTYGIVMGNEEWPAVRQKAYALGYYGVTSRITYSNHHNSSDDVTLSGWEIIVSADAKEEDLEEVSKIKDKWEEHYKTQENHIRVYTRNYNTGSIFDKGNEEYYYFTDYYAVIRLPYQLFNVRNVLYEGSYLSNTSDFEWYYTNGNWKVLSEDKIKVYVESLGIKYIAPSKS